MQKAAGIFVFVMILLFRPVAEKQACLMLILRSSLTFRNRMKVQISRIHSLPMRRFPFGHRSIRQEGNCIRA